MALLPSIDVNDTSADQPSNPLLTVVVNTYNRSDQIAACLNSVLTQSYSGYELLVVDDGSTDNTAEVIQAIDAPNLVYIRLAENGGISRARNRAIAEAKGQFIVFLDDDDRLDEGFLASVSEALQDVPDTVGFAIPSRRYMQVDGSRSTVLRHQNFGCHQRTTHPGAAYLANPISGASGLALRTTLAREINGFAPDVLMGEDTDLMLRAAAKADFMIVPEAVLIVRDFAGEQATKNKRRYAQYGVALKKLADVRADLLARYPNTRCHLYRKAARLYYAAGNPQEGRAALLAALRVAPLSYKTWGLLVLLEVSRLLPPVIHKRLRVHARHA